jgi:hypothetical protein
MEWDSEKLDPDNGERVSSSDGFTSHSKSRKSRVWCGSSFSHAKATTNIKIEPSIDFFETRVSRRSLVLRPEFHADRPFWETVTVYDGRATLDDELHDCPHSEKVTSILVSIIYGSSLKFWLVFWDSCLYCQFRNDSLNDRLKTFIDVYKRDFSAQFWNRTIAFGRLAGFCSVTTDGIIHHIARLTKSPWLSKLGEMRPPTIQPMPFLQSQCRLKSNRGSWFALIKAPLSHRAWDDADHSWRSEKVTVNHWNPDRSVWKLRKMSMGDSFTKG